MTAPINTVAPVMTGDELLGSVLTCSEGTWTGLLRDTITFQWYRDGLLMLDETNSTYTILTLDVGHVLTCEVTATNLTNEASSVLVNVLGYNTPAPVITKQDNDTNLFEFTPTTGVVLSTDNGVTFNPETSPYDVGYVDIPAGELQIKVPTDGINPESAVTPSTIDYTIEDTINICKVTMYVNDINGPETDPVKVRQLPSTVQYKTNQVASQGIQEETPDGVTGYVEFDLIETENMIGGEYLIDFGTSSYRFQVPNQATANFWDLNPVASRARV